VLLLFFYFLKLIWSYLYQVLGFGEYIEEVYAAYEQHKMETVVNV